MSAANLITIGACVLASVAITLVAVGIMALIGFGWASIVRTKHYKKYVNKRR